MLTRFAPAPTGWLHLGHVLNAEYVWGSHHRVILRIEDHDRERCRPEYEAGILEDLAWLGYVPDFPVVRQSDRDAVYRRGVDALIAQGLVYACDCTRKDIEARAAGADRPAPIDSGAAELVYDGHCRGRRLAIADGVGWRVRMDPGVERFDDLLAGPQAQDPSGQCGDVLIRDRLGNWTYQFAVSVDDFDQEIDLVIRGIDLLASTGRQIRLARLLGRTQPAAFMHHPLLMKSPAQKLSKSDGDTGVRELRARGWTPADVKSAAIQALRDGAA
ncbi:MAG TPA: glutamate--tRNA ligase family protein [Vicinamibacterales bacterium]|nr:glutamate--tRNA ligase family protein [Vicinamibacterales bacterium]